ncbi:helix-turn-helix transcriptional regulator [Azonexus caeni]|jgi:predicted DNA-binding transcriptional regulator AlpA|uniref:helix-turn-helix transcriptional regulator n=1 Tax=Azonexus caeni TaxID=266126 RepID=UPI003A87FAFE
MITHSVPAPATVAALEKIPHAARRMGLSVCGLYREAKAGRLTIVKVGARASAVSSQEVDKWIADRIAAAKGGAA